MTLPGMAKAIPCLALDIGGTKAEVAMVSREGLVLRRDRLDVQRAGVHLFDEIAGLLARVRADDEVSALGVACAGPMLAGGVSVSPLNIPVWRDFALRDHLERATGLPVGIEGDVRALALAEGTFGAARGVKSYASMVVSTGVGGALVLDGRLVNGDSGNAGHLGHLNVVPDGRLCSCGSRGCLEAEASGWAIAEMTGQSPEFVDESVRRRTATLVGRAIGTLAAVLDFNHCYVAGSVALGYGDDFFAIANSSAREVATLSYVRDLVVERSGLRADGPILGAACVAWRTVS
ncbi:MAG: ROK family protein [Acidimicrobiaceae bacterium]|nr:ROK family protein [Acidimicrobiaceae bacterium]